MPDAEPARSAPSPGMPAQHWQLRGTAVTPHGTARTWPHRPLPGGAFFKLHLFLS